MDIKEIMGLACSCVAVLVILGYIVIKAIKNKWVSKIYAALKEAINEAEKKYPDPGTGELKKKYVMDKLVKTCDELGVPYKLLASTISKLIDSIIANYNVITKGK